MERVTVTFVTNVNIPLFSKLGPRPVGTVLMAFPIVLFLDSLDKDYFDEFYEDLEDSEDRNDLKHSPLPYPDPGLTYPDYYGDYYGDYNELTGLSYSSSYFPVSSGQFSSSGQYYYPSSSSSSFSSSSSSPSSSFFSYSRVKRGVSSPNSGNVNNLPPLELGKTRNLAEDQLALFYHLETSLTVAGVDGRACMLRAVCEGQSKRLIALNLLGHLLTAFLTPQDKTLLKPYWEAAEVGRAGTRGGRCAKHYPGCPVSLLDIFKLARRNPMMPTH
ncbi:uncharacterized protein LOC123499071 [Portunus trituberculatus]|uniref:uncharacterized protein LOC123499071 n=1 Tax=Portunus trituberculatus TaxID=210409 RepID=UPI001E1D0D87|nr:uncharacterized protein LOC123499071 [Portunus trituberculatus]